MPKIGLTKGFEATVSDEDFEYLSQWKWQALSSPKTRVVYAVRTKYYHEEGERKQKAVLMHRVVAERIGLDCSELIDHEDRNGLNNQRENLRSATKKQNNENISMREDNTSGHRGVVWHKYHNKWQAKIGHQGKYIHLGYFEEKEDAIKARIKAEEKYFTHITKS